MEKRSATNPFIAEVCTHYPQKKLADTERNSRKWLGQSMKDDCRCGDCFYCDGD